MSIRRGAFGVSRKGHFIESPKGVRGWPALPAVWVGTDGITDATKSGVVALDIDGNTVWEFRTNGVVGTTDPYGRMERDLTNLYVPFARNSSWQGTDGSSKSVAVLDLQRGSMVRMLDTGGNARSTAVNSAGQVVVGGNRNSAWPGAGGNASIWLFNADGSIAWTYDTGNTVNSVVFDHAGDVVAGGLVGGSSNSLWKLNGTTGALIAAQGIEGSGLQANCVDCDPGGFVFVRSNLGTLNRDTWGIPNSLVGFTWRAAFGQNRPVAALHTSPTSCVMPRTGPIISQVEAGTAIQSSSLTGSAGTIYGVCSMQRGPDCYVAGSGLAVEGIANFWRILEDTMELDLSKQVKFAGAFVRLTSVVSLPHWNF